MTNCIALVMLEFDRKDSPSSEELAKKYNIPKEEIWKGFARIVANRATVRVRERG